MSTVKLCFTTHYSRHSGYTAARCLQQLFRICIEECARPALILKDLSSMLWKVMQEKEKIVIRDKDNAFEKILISRMAQDDYAEIIEIAKELPEWFDERAVQYAIPTDIKFHDAFVARMDQRIEGFISYYIADGRVVIGWLAVRKTNQGKGIGRELIERLGLQAQTMNIDEISSWVVGDAVNYEPYRRTRRFYESMGFEVYQKNRTNNPDCCEEYLVSKKIQLRTARD